MASDGGIEQIWPVCRGRAAQLVEQAAALGLGGQPEVQDAVPATGLMDLAPGRDAEMNAGVVVIVEQLVVSHCPTFPDRAAH
jgi:hypothetical protein